MQKLAMDSLRSLPASIRQYIQQNIPDAQSNLGDQTAAAVHPKRRKRKQHVKSLSTHPPPPASLQGSPESKDASGLSESKKDKKLKSCKQGIFPDLISVDTAGRSLALGWKPKKGTAQRLIDAVRNGEPLPKKKFKEKQLPAIATKGNPAQTNSFKIARKLARHVSGRVNISVRSKGFSCIVAKSGLAFNVQDDEAELTEQTGLLRRHVSWCGRMFRKAVKHGCPGLMLQPFVKLMKSAGLTNPAVASQAFKVFCTRGVDFLTFSQWVGIFALFARGCREEQAKVLFKIIDSSRDGSISQFEMLHFFVADLDSKDEAKRVSAIVNEMMSKVEDVGAGGLTLQLFTLKVVEDTSFWSCLQQISPFGPVLDAMENGKATKCKRV